MKNIKYRFKLFCKNIKKNILEILKVSLSIHESIHALSMLLDLGLVDSDFSFVKIFVNYYWYILISIIVISFVKRFPKETICTYKFDGCDIEISLSIGKIENQKNAIAFSTNTSFITRMDKEIISLKSAQGAYQKKFFINNLKTLDLLVCESLKETKKIKTKKICGKVYSVYSKGTVAKINEGNRNVYLIADSDINEHGTSIEKSIESVYCALNGFWNFLIEKGHVENVLTMTLIGSGRTGIKEATREEIIRIIVDTYIATSKSSSKKIVEKLNILINPLDIEKIDINSICKYIEYNTRFQTKNEKEKEVKSNVIKE